MIFWTFYARKKKADYRAFAIIFVCLHPTAALAAFAIEAARWSSPVVLALVMVDRAHLDLTAHRPDGDVSLELDSRVLDGPAIFPGCSQLLLFAYTDRTPVAFVRHAMGII